MITLLSVVIVAGLFFESNQEPAGEKKALPMSPLEPECWTDWFDEDDATGTGDWETLYHLRYLYPGKICPEPIDIEAQTLTSNISAAATGDEIYLNDVTAGFICKNSDKKKCNDYRVRFRCHPSFCDGGACWTEWYDRDNPTTGTGDWETLNDLRAENPGQICEHPLYIEAVTTDTMTPASSTGETFYANNATMGFVCRKNDQKDGNCRDYKVRFGCACND